MPTIASSSMARVRAARFDSFACRRIASMSWLPTVWNADSELIGSWNTRPISPPRMARISVPSDGSFARSTTRPSARRSSHFTADNPAGAFNDAQDRAHGDALAAAGLADNAQRATGVESNDVPSTARTTPSSCDEMRVEVAHG